MGWVGPRGRGRLEDPCVAFRTRDPHGGGESQVRGWHQGPLQAAGATAWPGRAALPNFEAPCSSCHQMASRLAPASGPLHSSPLLSALAQLLPQDPGTVLPGPESQVHQLRDCVPRFPHHKIKTVLGPSTEDSCKCEPTNTWLVLAQALAHWPLTQFRTTPTGPCFPPCLHCSALTTHFSGAGAVP